MAQATALNPQIQASVLHAAKDLRIETREVFPPAAHEVQVSVRATGLCGSDLHYYNHGRNGDIIMKEPMSLGHESSGVVVAVGAGVTKLQVGDKVAMEVGLPCEKCDRCVEGRYNICKDMRFAASARNFPHTQGTLKDRMNHPAAWCHKLPENVSLELGALLEPLGVAIHGTRRAQIVEGSTAVVYGAGAVGLLVAAMAKISGAGMVIIADIDSGRVNFAVENGFAHRGYTVPMKRGATTEEQFEIARETASNIGKVQSGDSTAKEADVSFECTGVASCLQAAIFSTRPGGKVMMIGMGTPVQTLPISAAALREVDLVGVFRYSNTYPRGIEVISKTGPDYPKFHKMITHRYSGLDEIDSAFNMAAKTKDEKGNLVIKVMIDTDDSDRARL